MKAAIITLAGISSRFNEGIPESEKIHKSIYFEGEKKDTILFHLLKKLLKYKQFKLQQEVAWKEFLEMLQNIKNMQNKNVMNK